jgi:Tfp pilus assembly protein PilO
MGPRERLIASVVAAIVVIAAMWIGLVSPKRKDANNLSASITTEQQALSGAQQQLAAAEQARAAYPAEARSLTLLTRAVPTSDQVPQLIRLINGEEASHKIDYTTTGFGESLSGSFPSINLTFTFDDFSYIDLQQFLGAFDALTLTNGSSVLVHGRLVTINSVSLTPTGSKLSAQVNMTTYEAPAATPFGASGAIGVTGATTVVGTTGLTGTSGATTPTGTTQ